MKGRKFTTNEISETEIKKFVILIRQPAEKDPVKTSNVIP